MTWPLVAHLGSSMTYGAELTRTVPLFNLWTLEWNQLQAGDLYSEYWNAPIFHPTARGVRALRAAAADRAGVRADLLAER